MENERLDGHTVLKIGGPARLFAEVKTANDFITVLLAVKSLKAPWMILGAGSNILVADRGFDGAIIHWLGGGIKIQREEAEAEAPVAMARAAAETLKAGLGGFEWAVGIPGTIGGSVRGNAGCFGGEMKDVVKSIKAVDMESGKVRELAAGDAKFGYRDSIFKHHPELVIVSAVIGLKKDDPGESAKLIREYTAQRSKTQDIGAQSAGCIFKNVLWSRKDIDREKLLSRFPELSIFAGSPAISTGFLIDRAGLKGRAVGRAKISERHGNFFLNTGGATAEEMTMLINLAKEHIQKKYDILLEEEIQYVGF